MDSGLYCYCFWWWCFSYYTVAVWTVVSTAIVFGGGVFLIIRSLYGQWSLLLLFLVVMFFLLYGRCMDSGLYCYCFWW